MKEAMEIAQIEYKIAALEFEKATGEEATPVLAMGSDGTDLSDAISAMNEIISSRAKETEDIMQTIIDAANAISGAVSTGKTTYITSPTYDSGGVLKGMGGIKATNDDEVILNPALSSSVLSPTNNSNLSEFVSNLPKLFSYLPGLNSIMSEANNGKKQNENKVSYNFGTVNIEANNIDEFIDSIQQLVPSAIQAI